MLRWLFALVVVAHALIHLLGFVKAFELASIEQLSRPIGKAAGTAWLLAAIVLSGVAVAYLVKAPWWWMLALPAVLLSQGLIISVWHDAKVGTVANVIVLIGAAVAYGGWQFQSQTRAEVRRLLSEQPPAPMSMVTETRLDTLPQPVQRWLRRSEVVGAAMVQRGYLEQRGRMRTSPEGGWLPFRAAQWFNLARPGFVWSTRVRFAPGIHLLGRDHFLAERGHMKIALLGLLPVVDASGPKIDQGALLRFVAELMWFPSAVLRDYLQWQPIDRHSARVEVPLADGRVSGVFRFADNGDVVGFDAKRYFQREAGATLEDWHISVEPDGYERFAGVRVPARLAVTWKLAAGDYTWLNLELTHLERDINRE